MIRSVFTAFAVVAAAALAGCDQAEEQDQQLRLKILRGDMNPLDDPGGSGQPQSSVGSLLVKWIAGDNTYEQTVDLASDASEVPVPLQPARSTEARMTIRGLRFDNGKMYSGGRSLPFPAGNSLPPETALFMGPVETFTPVGTPITARMGVTATVLGTGGEAALLVGGFDASSSPVPATPYMYLYLVKEARVCSAADGCLTGEAPAPRRDGFALALSDGTVLHGLGRLASGAPDSSIYLTKADGSTEKLLLGGTPIPALYGVAVVLRANDEVLLLGGHDGALPQTTVFALKVSERTVTTLAALNQARAFAGASLLPNNEVLIVGGEGVGGPLASAEVYQGNVWTEPDAIFLSSRKTLEGPRVSPAMLWLADQSVLIWGGGTPGGEVFRFDGGNRGGFIDLADPPGGIEFDTPALLRMPLPGAEDNVLIVGGEPSTASGGQAVYFNPGDDQLFNTPVYQGSYDPRPRGSAVLRAKTSAVRLGDASILLAGGGISGVGGTGPNPGSPRIEIMVPVPD